MLGNFHTVVRPPANVLPMFRQGGFPDPIHGRSQWLTETTNARFCSVAQNLPSLNANPGIVFSETEKSVIRRNSPRMGNTACLEDRHDHLRGHLCSGSLRSLNGGGWIIPITPKQPGLCTIAQSLNLFK